MTDRTALRARNHDDRRIRSLGAHPRRDTPLGLRPASSVSAAGVTRGSGRDLARIVLVLLAVWALLLGLLPASGGGAALADPASPTVTEVTPASGSVSGGTTVTITGSGLNAVDEVLFAGLPGTDLDIAHDGSSLTVVTPPSANLAVQQATLSLADDAGAVIASGAFMYKPDLTEYRVEHVTLGELASRSQRKPVTRTATAPYLVFGTDSRTGDPYLYETDYDYVNRTAAHPAYLRESDERQLDPNRIGTPNDFRAEINEHPSLPAVTRHGSQVIDARDGVLELYSYAWCASGNTFDSITTYCSVFGPEVYTEPFFARSDQALAFDWAANRDDDDYEIYAFLVEVDDPSVSVDIPTDPAAHTLIAHGQGWDQNWTTATGDIPADGYYRFRFVNGSYDGTGGTLVGSNMYIDDLVLVGLRNRIQLPEVGDQVGAGSDTFAVSPVTATSGAPVEVTSLTPNVCTVSVDPASPSEVTVTKVALGNCTLRAAQGLTGEYAPAATPGLNRMW